MVELIDRHKLKGNIMEWCKAYDEELNSVHNKRLTEIGIDSAEYRLVLKQEKVIRLRMNPEPKKDGRKKMRLLVRGDTEPRAWNDGACLDSPTVMASTVKMMIALQDTTDEEEYLSIGDISTAFLTSPEYDASAPKRYVGYRSHRGAPLRIFQLRGSLYGQKDAPQRFYDSLKGFLLSLGFKVSKNDVCLYSKGNLKVATHVDDVLCRGTKSDSEWFWAKMEAKYCLKDWQYVLVGQPGVYCGLNITVEQDGEDKTHCIDQNADVATFLADNMDKGMRLLKSPMGNKSALTADDTVASAAQQTWFRSKLMSISWFACQTRFDLSYTVSRLAQKMHTPTVGACTELKRVIAYLAYRPEFVLRACRAKRPDDWKLYVDSDHAGDQKITPRSHSGIIFFLNGMPVHWKSKKQPMTALSSAAAEIYAFSEAVKDMNLLLWRAEDIGVKVEWPAKIFEDNKATVSFQHSTQPSTKLRGIYNLRWNWVLELRDTSRVVAVKISTDLNIADMMTKCYKPGELDRMLRLCKMVH
jgi:hypothetical protein